MRKIIFVHNKYVLIPVCSSQTEKDVSIYAEGKKQYEFSVPVGTQDRPYSFLYYAPVCVQEWMGKQITIEGDVPESFLEAVSMSDSVPVQQGKRPVLHFAPNTGWINDPNGMMYHNGWYHLFFQHNPFNVKWGNMSWGHAVSKDMLHWEQLDDVLYPDEDGTMFSGCAVVNRQKKLGLDENAEILFYTCAGHTSSWSKEKAFVQKIAYSLDGGNSFRKKEGCILEHIAGDNRDPKVYWYEPRQLYFMVLYLDKNEYAIFNSEDLEHWEMTQRLTLSRAWECPDLVEVPVEGGTSKWMFWSADGYYFLGDFDGSHFETDGILHEAYCSMIPYAAQTFWGTERVICIPWLRTDNAGKLYTGVMGLPRQLTLVKKDDSLVLRQKLVDELEDSRKVMLQTCLEPDASVGQKQVCYTQKDEAAVEILLRFKEEADFSVNLYGTLCTYEKESRVLTVKGVAERSEGVKDAAKMYEKEELSQESDERFLKLTGEWDQISFLSDGEILEITVQDGCQCSIYETKADEKQGEICVQTSGCAQVKISQID